MNITTNVRKIVYMKKKIQRYYFFFFFSRVHFAFARSAVGWSANAYEYLLSCCCLWDYSCIKREADVCSEVRRMTEKREMREKAGVKKKKKKNENGSLNCEDDPPFVDSFGFTWVHEDLLWRRWEFAYVRSDLRGFFRILINLTRLASMKMAAETRTRIMSLSDWTVDVVSQTSGDVMYWG